MSGFREAALGNFTHAAQPPQGVLRGFQGIPLQLLQAEPQLRPNSAQGPVRLCGFGRGDIVNVPLSSARRSLASWPVDADQPSLHSHIDRFRTSRDS